MRRPHVQRDLLALGLHASVGVEGPASFIESPRFLQKRPASDIKRPTVLKRAPHVAKRAPYPRKRAALTDACRTSVMASGDADVCLLKHINFSPQCVFQYVEKVSFCGMRCSFGAYRPLYVRCVAFLGEYWALVRCGALLGNTDLFWGI